MFLAAGTFSSSAKSAAIVLCHAVSNFSTYIPSMTGGHKTIGLLPSKPHPSWYKWLKTSTLLKFGKLSLFCNRAINDGHSPKGRQSSPMTNCQKRVARKNAKTCLIVFGRWTEVERARDVQDSRSYSRVNSEKLHHFSIDPIVRRRHRFESFIHNSPEFHRKLRKQLYNVLIICFWRLFSQYF